MAKVSTKFYGGKPVFYVPWAQEWLAKHCKHVKMTEARPGDIVIFTWSGGGNNSAPKGKSRDHIGFIRKKGTAFTAYTIEGNTSGGKVDIRSRALTNIYGIYRLNINAETGKAVIDKAYNYIGRGGAFVWDYYAGLPTGAPWCAGFVSYTLAHTNIIPSTNKPTTAPTTSTPPKRKYSGTLPKLPKRGYLKNGDKGKQVKRLQQFLNWYGSNRLKTDGVFGAKTKAAVEKFQKGEKIDIDGKFGKKSLAKAKAYK